MPVSFDRATQRVCCFGRENSTVHISSLEKWSSRAKGRGGAVQWPFVILAAFANTTNGPATNKRHSREREREDISIMESEICVTHLIQHNTYYNETSLDRAAHNHASVSAGQLSIIILKMQRVSYLCPFC